MNPPARRESGDRHAGTLSRGRRCPEGAGEVLHPKWPIIIRRPALTQCLGRSAAVQPLAPSLEPAPDPDAVVRSGQIADHQGKEMETARHRVGRGATAGQVTSCTGLGDAQETSQQIQSHDVQQDPPLMLWGGRLIQSFADPLQQHGKPGWVWALHAIELGDKRMADAGFFHARLKFLHSSVVKAGNPSRQEAHGVGASQCRECRRCKRRFVKRTANGLYMEISHVPNAIHKCDFGQLRSGLPSIDLMRGPGDSP